MVYVHFWSLKVEKYFVEDISQFSLYQRVVYFSDHDSQFIVFIVIIGGVTSI